MNDLTHIRDVDTLIRAAEDGVRIKYLFFWGHTPKSAEQVDKSCLSQWFPASFSIDGVRYPSAEHYMMAEKARLFNDAEIAEKIVNAGHPNDAKKLGRQVRGFDNQTWAAHRFEIVVRANTAKFGQNPTLRTFLLGTNSRVLVEASPYDAIWGIGLQQDDRRAQHPAEWQGLNLLGFALMEARQNI